MWHFNSTVSIQSCSHFGALNLSYTLPSLSYQVFIFTRVKWSTCGWSALPNDTTSGHFPKIEMGWDIFLKILNQAGFETARQAATSAERHALSIAPYCVIFIVKYQETLASRNDIILLICPHSVKQWLSASSSADWCGTNRMMISDATLI